MRCSNNWKPLNNGEKTLTEMSIEQEFEEDEEEIQTFTRQSLLELVDAKISAYLDRCRKFHEEAKLQVLDFITGNRTSLMVLDVLHLQYCRVLGSDKESIVSSLFNQLSDLAREKGLRTNTDSYDEHISIGSSGFGRFSKYCNVPIGVVNYLYWQEMGFVSGEILSIEEADRARQLEGRAGLNSDGTISDEHSEQFTGVDCYRFLSPERRKEVRKIERIICDCLEQIFEASYSEKKNKLEHFHSLIVEYIEGRINTPFVKECAEDLEKDGKFFNLFLLDSIDFMGKNVIDEARELSYKSGVRNWYLTPQELTVMGIDFDPKYLKNPWTPLALQDGSAFLSDIVQARTQEREIRWLTGALSGYELYFEISLERLDQDGKTVAGPFRNCSPESDETFKDRANVPFSREGDWYHKGV